MKRWMVVGVLAVLVSGARVGLADETELPVTPPAPDTPAVIAARVGELATQYGVTQERVNAMRQLGMGWGELENALALARQVAANSVGTSTPLTMDLALDAILAARAEGRGWGEIAKSYGIRWGDIVSGVHSKGHAEALDKPAKVEKIEKPDKPERPDKPDKPETAGKANKPDKPEKPEHGKGNSD
jgi:hypothetical protein